MRSRSALRARWRSWLGLAIIVGAAGGFVIAAAAGARRTSSVYTRLLAVTAPFDVALGCPDLDEATTCRDEQRPQHRAALALPEVATGTLVTTAHVPIMTSDGRSLQPEGEVCFGGPGEVDLIGSPERRFGRDINRYLYVAGHAPDPARAEHVALSAVTARRLGIRVGDQLRVTPIDACTEVAEKEWPAPIIVTVTGITLAPTEVQPSSGVYIQSVTASPELLARITGNVVSDRLAAVRLRDGVTVPQYMAAVKNAGLDLVPVIVQRDVTAGIDKSLRPDTVALGFLTTLGAVAALIIVAQILSRQVWSESAAFVPLRALGFTRRDLTAAGAIEGAVIGVIGAACAVAFALAVSPLAPIGRAHDVEPARGVRGDALVFGGGAIAVVVLTALLVAAAAWRVSGSRVRHRKRAPLAVRGTQALECGARMALDTGAGTRSVPVRTGVAGLSIGLLAVFGAVTFNAGLDNLLTNARLVGVNWDAGFFDWQSPDGDPDARPDLEALLPRVQAIDGIARASFATIFPPSEVAMVDKRFETWPISFGTGPHAVRPAVTDGRAPERDNEVLLTRRLLQNLGLHVGDTVVLHGPTTRDAPFTIVGAGPVPAPFKLADGLALTFAGMQRLDKTATPGGLLVDFESGADRTRVTAAMNALGFSPGVGGAFERAPIEFVGLDVRQADLVPQLLAALMAVLAAAILVHLVVTSARLRRHDLATLQAIGFTRRQVRATLAWSATTVTTASLLVAAIVGIVAGRLAWEAYARHLDVVPEAVVPWPETFAISAAALILANLTAIGAGYLAERRSPGRALHAE
jgi:ABC-type lipoprotein release transport system permease subunit